MRYLTAVLLVLTVTFTSYAKDKVKIGDVPPSYVGRTMGGDKIELSEMKGKVVVMTFWATWCPPCMAELPILYSLQNLVSADRMQVVAVNYGESVRAVKKVMDILKDSDVIFTRDRKKFAARKYGVKGIPHMVILDHAGKVAKINIGYGEESLDRLVDELNGLLVAMPRAEDTPEQMGSSG